ncbi:MAG TPA: hypothetical protein PLD03_16035 [Thiomonas arsenitoxydans]|nr:hypothetical protein [Thiomonas arsenitoxydans]
MTAPKTLFDRIDQAAKLSRKLTGKTAASTLCDAFVQERTAEIRKLQHSGVAMARYARLIAPQLGVRPAALVAAIGRAIPLEPHTSGEQPPATSRTQRAKGKSPPPVATVASIAPAPAPLQPQPAAVPTNPGTQGKPTQHSTIPSARLPDWADWSDQMSGESDDDYIFRKALEMPPGSQSKFIGESPAERTDALLKTLDFGAAGPTDSDRKLIRVLVERFGADTVQRRIAAERKAQPGSKLYPSVLHKRMTGDGHA